MTGATSTDTRQQPLTVRRSFDFDRETVFKAWTDPEAVAVWFGGPEANVVRAVADVRVGGHWQLVIEGGGRSASVGGIYKEVEPPERLVYTWSWDQGRGPGRESVVTVEFLELDGGTEIVVTHEGLASEESLVFHQGGWTLSLEQLERMLS